MTVKTRFQVWLGVRDKDGHLHRWRVLDGDPRWESVPGFDSWVDKTGIQNPFQLAQCTVCGKHTELDPESR